MKNQKNEKVGEQKKNMTQHDPLNRQPENEKNETSVYGESDSLKKEKQSPRNNPARREKNQGLDINTEG